MDVQELYRRINGDYESAKKIMMMDAIIAKMIVRYPNDQSCAALVSASEAFDPKALFEAAHALKGVTANLGLKEIYSRASALSEEFREGKPRTMSDDAVRAMIAEIKQLDQKAKEEIRAFS